MKLSLNAGAYTIDNALHKNRVWPYERSCLQRISFAPGKAAKEVATVSCTAFTFTPSANDKFLITR